MGQDLPKVCQEYSHRPTVKIPATRAAAARAYSDKPIKQSLASSPQSLRIFSADHNVIEAAVAIVERHFAKEDGVIRMSSQMVVAY